MRFLDAALSSRRMAARASFCNCSPAASLAGSVTGRRASLIAFFVALLRRRRFSVWRSAFLALSVCGMDLSWRTFPFLETLFVARRDAVGKCLVPLSLRAAAQHHRAEEGPLTVGAAHAKCAWGWRVQDGS